MTEYVNAEDCQFDSLVHLLETRAADRPKQLAYTFLRDGEVEEGHLSYGELARRARAVGAWLQERNLQNRNVLLLYPPSLEYIVAFWGCLYAGAVAVPAYPPRRNRHFDRLQTIVADAQSQIALTTSSIREQIQSALTEVPALSELTWGVTEEFNEQLADSWRAPQVNHSAIAFLQYTSGSTATPKGVMVTHGGLLHNEKLIRDAFHQSEHSVIVGWLPLYHDMGLIGNVLQPLYLGARCILMSPLAFLQQPARWLRAISRYRGTTSGGPNFAYDLCSQKISREERDLLDLNCWTVAFNGAEPVRADTLQRFTDCFAPCGFKREAFYPCYGLAEATLFVSGARVQAQPTIKTMQRTALERGFAVTDPEPIAPDLVSLVGCGAAQREPQIVIANPESLALCAPGEVGEVWISGASVAAGYWNRPKETANVFQAYLSDSGAGPYLRSGDLGFLESDELFVTGRIKDLIIIRGRNLYPHDLERTVEKSHSALRAGGGAAFSIDNGSEERLVIVHEIGRHVSSSYDEVIGNIRQSLAEEHEVQPYSVVLVATGVVPKTSSGKTQRSACREMFLSASLAVVAAWNASDDRQTSEAAFTDLDSAESLAVYLRAQLASRLGVDSASIDVCEPITRYGFDSLSAIEMAHAIESQFGVEWPMAALLEGPSLLELAGQLRTSIENAAAKTPIAAAPAKSDTHALSHGQQALWFLHRLNPKSAAYNVAAAVRIQSALDTKALKQAFALLAQRHDVLRTTFDVAEGKPTQTIHEDLSPQFTETDASSWNEAKFDEWLGEEASRPFELSSGRLACRVNLYKRPNDEYVLLIVAHHVIVDFWSIAVMWQEVGELYTAQRQARQATLPPLQTTYTDYVCRQMEMLEGKEGERLGSYWQKQLGENLPVLNLPSDRPRPPVQSNRGAAYTFKLDSSLTRRLKALAHDYGATVYATLLAAFETLLYRYTGQESFAVGSPSSGRDSAALTDMVGYFVNPLVMRADFSGRPSFVELLARVRRNALDALAHQAFPFALLVQRLQPERDPSRTPLFETMFVYQPSQLLKGETLVSVAGGEAGLRFKAGELHLESLALPQRTAIFDLMISVTEAGDTLLGSIEYSTDLFDEASIRRMAGHFQTILETIVENPRQRVAELELLTPDEQRQLVFDWNETALEYDASARLHELFEAQVERTPGATALVYEDERLSYEELNERANQLAHYLRRLGVGPETLVGVFLERSPLMIVAMLGVLKSGGAYVPLDISYPRERLQFTLEDADVKVVLTQSGLQSTLPQTKAEVLVIDERGQATLPDLFIVRSSQERTSEEEWPATAVEDARACASNLAYVIYTSGSTGRPKGVAIEHRSAVALIHWSKEQFRAEHLAGVLASTSICFDLSVFEIFVPLSTGGKIILAANALELPSLPAASEVILINTVPSAMTELVRLDGVPDSVRVVNLAGEPLQNALVQSVYEYEHVEQVLNLYGPSEDTTYSTWTRIEKDNAAAPTIGRPVANTQAYLLDAHLQLVPVGVAGELFLGGFGLARGYLNRPELTAERFVPDPFSGVPGARLYRTGDLARYQQDGRLEYLGRLDHQLKLRGFRIELGEIETVLREHDAVQDAVVVAHETEPGEKQLVAYVVADGPLTTTELRDWLKQKLPHYMIPAAFVALAKLPLSPNGKIDRHALPAPRALTQDLETGFVAPRNQIEEIIAGIWAAVLGLEQVGIHHNFFDLGGHSLLATQVIARLNEAFQVDLPLSYLFESPTVAVLAERVTQKNGTHYPQPIERVARDAPLPLSFAQQRLWFLDQLEPGSAAYHVPILIRLTGSLNVSTLERSIREVINRHESLRTTFRKVDERPVQVIAPPGSWRLDAIDLSDVDEPEREALRRAKVEARLSFDLSTGPLLRATVWRVGADVHILLLSMHHIVADGWSIGIIVSELSAFYNAFAEDRPAPLAELPCQYVDFAQWQRKQLSGDHLAEHVDYWKQRLSGPLPPIELPGRRVQSTSNQISAATESREFPKELSSSLQRLSRHRGVTTFMTLLATFQVLLHRYTGLDDIVVGTPVANRTRIETESLIGFFANTLVLRGDLSGDPSFDDLLARVRTLTLEAHAHQDVPFELLVEELQPERDLDRTPLFQIMLVMQNTPPAVIDLPGVRVEQLKLESTAPKFDLILVLKESDGSLTASWEYNPARFDAETIKGLASHFETLLESAIADPNQRISRLKMLPDDEWHSVIIELNETTVEYPYALGIHELFEAQAARTPEATALIYNDEQLSYEQLNERANQLAHHLRALGVGPETLVGICLERSLEMVIGLLGILKAGAAYVPLDPSYPQERLRLIIEEAEIRRVLTQQRFREIVSVDAICLDTEWQEIAGESKENPAVNNVPGNLAYVIYTSGSTGKPKGSMITHEGICNRLLWMQQTYQLTEADRVLQKTPYTFDVSVWEFFWPLITGARLVMARPGGQGDSHYLVQIIKQQQITTIHFVPSMLTVFLEERGVAECCSLKRVICSGETLPYELKEKFVKLQPAELHNLYGPTEASVDVTYWDCRSTIERPIVPIGRPIANTQIYVLDKNLQAVPLGVSGELYIGGIGLARGYLKRADLTAERFLPDPFGDEGARIYRTGDLARYLADGNIEYLGRTDFQVKLRGFRIELGEIESALNEHPAVRQAVVVAREENSGGKRLVAYVVPEPQRAAPEVVGSSRKLFVNDLRERLNKRLPEYMVPTDFVLLAELPTTSSGKLDRRALPDPAEIALEPTAAYVEPRTRVELQLAQMWQQLLNRERISVHDNFFELGGHSLLATQVVSRVREMFEIDLPVRSIFEAKTIADLAERIERSVRATDTRPISPAPRNKALPLSFAQQRLWFLDQAFPGNPAYNIQAAVRLSGSFNPAAFASTLNEIVQRHEVLRTTFHIVDGQPTQVISPVAALSLTNLSTDNQRNLWLDFASEEARRPFDLTQGPLLRATLLRLAETEHVLLLSVHHIVADGWSMGVLMQEVAALYPAFVEAKPLPLAELPIQYADFAVWQRQWLQGEVLYEQVDYWRQQLAGFKPLALPTDRPRPPVQNFRGARRFFSFPAEISNELRALSRREGVTLYMTLLAAWQTLLHRYTSQNEIVVGTDIANRNRRELESLIGFFTNQLVLRVDFSGNPTFKELLRRVREVTLGAYAHQDLPFEKLVEVLQLERTLDRNPLFQVMFVFQNTPVRDLELPGLSLHTLETDEGTTAFDLTLTIEETDEGLKGSMRYSTDLFNATTIERMIKHFQNIIRSIVASIETTVQALEMYDPEVRKKERTTSRLKKLASVKPRAVTFSGDTLFETSYLTADQRLPLVIQFARVDLPTWARRHEEMIEAELLRHGAILFRGFDVNSLRAFEEFTRAVSRELLEYGERSSPRTRLSAGIYTSTDHPADQHIVLHNEQSYTLNWPMKILFCCLRPAEQGGRTPIAGSREIYRRLDPALIRLFEKKSVMYVRNYGDGLGLPWQEVFQTRARSEVEEHCRRAAIVCEWKDGNRLCTRQLRPAVRTHPKTGEWVWFNHALFFHVSSLDAATQAAFAGLTADELPFNTLFGDGTPIDPALMEEIREAYREATVSFPWQTGDVLMLDNMLVAHGREPFVGPRKVVVAMADPFHSISQPAEMHAAAQVSAAQ